MQFHLNGFQPADPTRATLAARDRSSSMVDVLIVGSGPAGLTLAAQLARFGEINTRLIEQKPGPIELGQADGVACRTMEMFNAFGFADRLLKEAYWVNETVFWKPDVTDRDAIVRSTRIPDTEEGLSEFPHVILNQARVHDFYLEAMRHAPGQVVPDYNCMLASLSVDPALGDFPVIAEIEHIAGERRGQIESVRARYVVGCDGARSGVRSAIGLPLVGDSANQAWGVMDVLAVTDFPDVRLKAAIHSAQEGSVLIIPREGGYLVRFYVELDKLDPNERIASRGISIDRLIEAARRILHPFTLEVKEVAWWSVYEIGQRICARFDDAAEAGNARSEPRIFIAGDACHTHSPKAGQGMNVSMQDSFNLGWKLASVLTGRSTPAVLSTYSDERRAIAQELIDFDRAFAKMFSAPPKDEQNPDGIDPTEFQDYFVRQGRFTAGTATRYPPSLLVAGSARQHLAEGFPLGMRFHSAPVLRLADAKPMHLGHMIEADGRWRLIAFGGSEDPADPSSPLVRLCDFLENSPRSPFGRFTPKDADIDSVIDFRAVFQQPRHTIALENLPALLLPKKGRYGLIDYEKAFCRDPHVDRDIYRLRDIDMHQGCLLVIRPDQYVAHILPLDATGELASFFDAFMVEAGSRQEELSGARSSAERDASGAVLASARS